MRYPFWILNSTLFVVLLIVFAYIIFSQQGLPEREDIEPMVYVKPVRTGVSEINLRKIYENDLFGTYQGDTIKPEEADLIPEVPAPPSPKVAEPITWPKPEFLEPLAISLKGIMIISNDQARNSVVISDKKTNRETVYRVGDILDDAQLLKIFKDKIIFLRSNGQQEVLYLREYDAKLDPVYALTEGWQEVIQKLAPDEYQISPKEFSRRVLNLAEFIDLLDITTVYSKGVVIGLRIGRTPEKSLGASLGLQAKDIVTALDENKIDEGSNKFDLYKKIIATPLGDYVVVSLLRNNNELTLRYKLEDFTKNEDTEPQATLQTIELKNRQQNPTKQQINILKKHHEFAPTADEIRRKNRIDMMKANQKPKSLNSNLGRPST